MKDTEIIDFIDSINKNKSIATLKKLVEGTKYNVDIDYSFAIMKKEVQFFLTIAILEHGDVVMYHPQNNEYDESFSLIASDIIACYDTKTQQLDILELDDSFEKNTKLITEKIRDIILGQ